MITQEIHDQEVFKLVASRGFDIFGIDKIPNVRSDIEALLGMVPEILKNAPAPTGAVDAPLRRGQYLSGVGLIVGMLFEAAFGWSLAEIRKDDEDVDDGVMCVLSPDNAYFVFPIALAYKEAHWHGGETRAVYEKIKRGDLPDVPPGSFHEIKP
jgi:hypothetical protein